MQGVLSVVSHVQFYFSLNLSMMSLQVPFFCIPFSSVSYYRGLLQKLCKLRSSLLFGK